MPLVPFPSLLKLGDPRAQARQCTATSKRTGKRCQAPAMIGKTVCYYHGGAVGYRSQNPPSPRQIDNRASRMARETYRRMLARDGIGEDSRDWYLKHYAGRVMPERIEEFLVSLDHAMHGGNTDAWLAARDRCLLP